MPLLFVSRKASILSLLFFPFLQDDSKFFRADFFQYVTSFALHSAITERRCGTKHFGYRRTSLGKTSPNLNGKILLSLACTTCYMCIHWPVSSTSQDFSLNGKAQSFETCIEKTCFSLASSYIAQPIGRSIGIGDVQRHQSHITPLGKFSESFWRFVFYLSIFLYGLAILQRVSAVNCLWCSSRPDRGMSIVLFQRNPGYGIPETVG